ncbi:MAG: hypothetical protein WCP29_13790 [Acidobacteriota bacterium]
MDPIAEIKRLYYAATRSTIERDLAQAVALLKTLDTEEARERVAVYMDGLSQMRSEWDVKPAAPQAAGRRPGARGAAPIRKASTRPR